MFIKRSYLKVNMTSFFVESYGSWQSLAQAERINGLLQQARFNQSFDLESTDITIISLTQVTLSLEEELYEKLDLIKKKFPHQLVIIVGCFPHHHREKLKLYPLISSHQIHRIVEVVEERLSRNIIKVIERNELPALDLPKVRQNKIIEIIPITLGCVSDCIWCSERKITGEIQSYPQDEIVGVAQKAINQGVKELLLSSHDAAAYGKDLNLTLVDLLSSLISLPGEFQILIERVYPVSVSNLLSFQDQLATIFQHSKMFQFLSLPIFATSNNILQQMSLTYSIEDLISFLKYFRSAIPNLTISTNIITGFPAESQEEFWQTLEFMRKINPDITKMSIFTTPSKSPLAKLPSLEATEKQRRYKVLADVAHNTSILQNERWKNWQGTIIIDQQGEIPGEWIGHNQSYKPIIIKGNFKLGNIVSVKVMKTTDTIIQAEVIRILPEL